MLYLHCKTNANMKSKGNHSDYIAHRAESIAASFRKIMEEAPVETETAELYRLTAKDTAPRFWVSDQRAAIVISSLEKADRLAETARKRKKIGLQQFDTTDGKRKAMLEKIHFGTIENSDRATPHIEEEFEGKKNGGIWETGTPAGAEGILQGMYPERAEMYRELYRRYKEERARGSKATIISLVAGIVYGKAPHHYLSAGAVRKILQQRRRNKSSAKCYIHK